MPFGAIHRFPGGTKEQYELLIARVHPSAGTLPDGQTFLSAGPTADGWVVISLWDSEECWTSFRDGVLLPCIEHLGDEGLGASPHEVTFEVHTATNGLIPIPRQPIQVAPQS